MPEDQQNDRSAWIDRILQLLAEGADTSGLEMSLTLSVGGLLISGRLVSGSEYLRAVADEFDHDLGDNILSNALRTAAEKRESRIEDADTEGSETQKLPPEFIHLKNARVFHPGGNPIPNNRGTNWRIKLSAVDAFSHGELSA